MSVARLRAEGSELSIWAADEIVRLRQEIEDWKDRAHSIERDLTREIKEIERYYSAGNERWVP